MFKFLTLVDGREARAAYDCSSANSYITLSCLKSRGLKCFPQMGQRALVPVHASSGSLTCLVNLFSHPGSGNLDVVLGQDWFNYCTTAFEDAHIPLSDGHRLVFSASPFHAVFDQLVPGECILLSFSIFFANAFYKSQTVQFVIVARFLSRSLALMLLALVPY